VTPSDAQPIRLGLVGYGRLARGYYLPALRRLSGAKVVAVADPLDTSHAAAHAAFPSAASCRDLDELLVDRPDALLVATPPSTHLALWNAAQAAGLPVFLEKPFVLAGQLGHAAADPAARARLMVDFNRHFWPPYQRLRALAASGRIGSVRSATFTLHVDLLPWCEVTRHRLSSDDGGLLHDLGSQALALVPWLLDAQPVTVEATFTSHRWPDDHAALRLTFANGAVTTCDLAYETRTFERATITGTEGCLRLEDPNMALHLDPARGGPRRGRLRDLAVLGYRALRPSHSMMRFSVHAALDAFVAATRQQTPLAPGWDVAARNVRALEAAVRAAATGGSVRLDSSA
jgi:myo-inositol 2-dehydrogenase/D-chiro-inositol 1-dehydrogenase